MKTTRVMLSVLMLLAMLIGPVYGAEVELTYWSPYIWLEDAYDFIIGQHEAMYPDVYVKWMGMSDEQYRSAVSNALAARAGADILTGMPTRTVLHYYVDTGSVANLADAYEKYGWAERYPDWMMDTLTYTPQVGPYAGQEGIWGVPTHVTHYVMFYNKPMFDRLGLSVPQTLEEFYDVCYKIKENGIYPIALGNKPMFPALMFVEYLFNTAAGDEFVKAVADGKESFVNPQFVRALDILQDFVREGFFNPGINAVETHEAEALWMSEQAAMNFNGDWTIATFMQGNAELFLNADFFPGPRISQDVPWTIQVLGGDVLVVNAASAHKREAMEFLDTHANEESVKVWIKQGGRVSAWSDMNRPEWGLLPIQERLSKAAGSTRMSAWLPPPVESVMRREIQQVINLTKTPEEALAAMEEASRAYWETN